MRWLSHKSGKRHFGRFSVQVPGRNLHSCSRRKGVFCFVRRPLRLRSPGCCVEKYWAGRLDRNPRMLASPPPFAPVSQTPVPPGIGVRGPTRANRNGFVLGALPHRLADGVSGRGQCRPDLDSQPHPRSDRRDHYERQQHRVLYGRHTLFVLCPLPESVLHTSSSVSVPVVRVSHRPDPSAGPVGENRPASPPVPDETRCHSRFP